jgi:UDP-glucose 4-epimerase
MQNNSILEGKRILVTGGTGSLGRALVRRLLAGALGMPNKVIVLSRDEAKQHAMRLSYLRWRSAGGSGSSHGPLGQLDLRIGDVRSYPDVAAAVRDADVVVNAAGLKQVPNCEYFPEQAILTNCMGPANIVRAVRETAPHVETVVGISTDKACKPVNVMGMTKAVHERVFIAAGVSCPATRFVCARYGNVLGSRGSVIPVFHEQIRQGGPVTVTVPEMTRFLMGLDDAVDCVFAALRSAGPGETLVPRIPSSTIHNLASALIGDRTIEIQATGIRPGEKLHEILISDEEARRTVRRGDHYAIRPMLPELGPDTRTGDVALCREFSSADAVINREETRQLLERHAVLPEQAAERGREGVFERLAA